MLDDLIRRCRTCRRFHAERPVTAAILRDLVDLARLSASAANKQPVRYLLSCTADRNARIFGHLKWAGYLDDWDGPSPPERPAAYIVLVTDTELSKTARWDDAITAWTIVLGATERGLGGCIIAAFDRPGLRADLNLPARYEPLLVVALGQPAETVVIEAVGPAGDIRYWRDREQVHHVPKRSLDEVIVDFG